jgi:transcriptional regulator with XRE-family HTH domain
MVSVSLRIRVGARLRDLRRARGLSQGELGRACDVSQREISSYEHGKAFPRLDRLEAIATALGVDPGELFRVEHPARSRSTTIEQIVAIVEAAAVDDPGFPARVLRLVRALIK